MDSDHDLFTSSALEDQPPRASLPNRLAQLPPAAPGSPSSEAAARAIAGAVIPQARRIHAYIAQQQARGATREEIAEAMALRLSAVCGRVRTLYRQGLIGSNPDVTRVSASSGMQAEILVADVFVARWLDTRGRLIPRRHRTLLDGALIDLVAQDTDQPLTESGKRLGREAAE